MAPRTPAIPTAHWQASAACRREDPELFFSPDYELPPRRAQREAYAKAICATCPVTQACLAFALDTYERSGIWGGLTEEERRPLIRRRPGPTPPRRRSDKPVRVA